jgi:hypothetical protein
LADVDARTTWLVVVVGVAFVALVGSTVWSAWKHRDRPIQRSVADALATLATRFGLARQGPGDVAPVAPMDDMLGRVVGRLRGYDVQVVVLARQSAFAAHAEDYTSSRVLVDVSGGAGPDPASADGVLDELRALASRVSLGEGRLSLVVDGDGQPPTDPERLAALLECACERAEALGIRKLAGVPIDPAFIPVPNDPAP